MLREDYGADESHDCPRSWKSSSRSSARRFDAAVAGVFAQAGERGVGRQYGRGGQGIHSMLRRMLSANIEMVTVTSEDLWPVLVDKARSNRC